MFSLPVHILFDLIFQYKPFGWTLRTSIWWFSSVPPGKRKGTVPVKVKTLEEIFLAHAFQFIIHKSFFSSKFQGINITINIIKFTNKQNNTLIQ